MKKLILLTFIMSGCASNSGTIPTSQYDKPGQLGCDRLGMIEYCEGRSQQALKCMCVNHNSLNNTTDFLWNE